MDKTEKYTVGPEGEGGETRYTERELMQMMIDAKTEAKLLLSDLGIEDIEEIIIKPLTSGFTVQIRGWTMGDEAEEDTIIDATYAYETKEKLIELLDTILAG